MCSSPDIQITDKVIKIGRNETPMGYSNLELKEHIESLFKNGMNWGNYGEWHIDHIKPLSLFSNKDDIKVVNSLSNLQPLWKNENLRKYNKFSDVSK